MFPKTRFVSWFSKTPATTSLSFCIPAAATPTLAPSPLCPEAATPHPSARLSGRPGPGKAHTTQRLHLHRDLPPCNLTFTDLCSLSLRNFCSGQTGLVHSWGRHSIIFSCLLPPPPTPRGSALVPTASVVTGVSTQRRLLRRELLSLLLLFQR